MEYEQMDVSPVEIQFTLDENYNTISNIYSWIGMSESDYQVITTIISSLQPITIPIFYSTPHNTSINKPVHWLKDGF